MKLPNKLFLAFILLSAVGYLGQAQGLPLLSTHCFSQEDSSAKAKEYYLAGNKLLEAGNYAAADAEFKKAQELLKAAPAKSEPAPQTSVTSVPEPHPEPPAKKPIPKPAKTERKKAQTELNIPQDMTPEEAIAFYLRASELLPRGPNLHYILAIAYLKTKQYPLAAETFKKAIRLNPKDKESYYNLAVLYENHLGNKKQALFYYGRYLKLSPLAEDAQKVKLWMRQIKEEFKLNE